MILLFSSCQKEADMQLTEEELSGLGNAGGGETTGANTEGELLVKMEARTGSDLNTVLLKWDGEKRLVEYISTGNSMGKDVSGYYKIIRADDGAISYIISKPSANPAVGVDSIVYQVFYKTGTHFLDYTKGTQYITGIESHDSTAYKYAGSRISEKTVYVESITQDGSLNKSYTEQYSYDGQGNLTKIVTIALDPASNTFKTASTVTYTYDAHKCPQQLKEEAYIVAILDQALVSPNNFSKVVMAIPAQASWPAYTITINNGSIQFNSTDKPFKGKYSLSSQPVVTASFDVNYNYYYQ
jgi:hypothetical protein